jgi:hypothetical protein
VVLSVDNEQLPVHWTCDLMVDNDYSGKGIAGQLYKKALENKLILGSDPSSAAVISMRRSGFVSFKGPVMFFRL